MGWRWEHGGAQRGPVTLEVASHGGVWEWHAWIEVAGKDELLACDIEIATEAEARRAAENAGDAFAREVAEAFGYGRLECSLCRRPVTDHDPECEAL